jgi:hypothetical protein
MEYQITITHGKSKASYVPTNEVYTNSRQEYLI